MMSVVNRTGLGFFALSLLIIGLDQATKLWIVDNLMLHQDINILPVFDITYAQNPGAAFSFLGDAGGWQRWLFTGIALVISALLSYWIVKTPSEQKLLLTAYSLILGGAIGNVIDRMAYGYVVDFLHFYYQNWHFPAFNVADIAISCGAALLILEAILEHKKQSVDSTDHVEQ